MSVTLLDGGMGQELLARAGSKPTSLWATRILLDSPQTVRAVHDDYFAAGAEIATTNSYGLLHDRLEPHGIDDRFAELHRTACRLACEARDAHGAGRVAGSLGPLGWSYKPESAPPAAEAAPLYAEIAALQAPYVDLYICETMSSADQARGAALGAAEGGKPVWLAVSVDDADGTRLRSGEPVEAVLEVAAETGAAALLVNCSVPEAVSQALPRLAGARVPLGAYANGFTRITRDFVERGQTVEALETRRDLDPAAYADFVEEWLAAGASIVGGCCEIGPAHIAELARRLKASGR